MIGEVQTRQEPTRLPEVNIEPFTLLCQDIYVDLIGFGLDIYYPPVLCLSALPPACDPSGQMGLYTTIDDAKRGGLVR